ncbi:MAG: hypothetical protein IJE40_01290 [Clostridia bacterium]|nr:hypothetical protein [Clostridia bacterium]
MYIKDFAFDSNKITVYKDRFEMTKEGVTVFSFPVQCRIPTSENSDKDMFLSNPTVTETEGGFRFEWIAASELWHKKIYILDIFQNCFYFRVKVYGNGNPEAIQFFMGAPDSSYPGSKYEVAGYALPEAANFDRERMTRFINHDCNIGMGFMTPPPFVYPFWTVGIKGWTGIGLIARKGQYNFNRFLYKNHNNRCHFEITLDGKTEVRGEWESQGIWGGFAESDTDAVKKYADFNYEKGFCVRGKEEKYRWWKGPIYCGWGDQVETGGPQMNIDHKDAACQQFYEKMSDRLDELDLHPTVMIIDDKWQGKYGELLPDPKKWHDMRAFTEAQHAKGRKVVLWVKVWNSEGLDADECLTLEQQPYAADPTNPKYQKRLYETVRKLLSSEEGCFNCDGFKLDFVNCIFMNRNISTYEKGVYGIELVKRMMELFYNAAKAVKPDALINNSCSHPYFAEITDQVRIHDYRDSMRSMMPVMQYRCEMFHAAMPHALIDTDSSNRSNYREAKEYCLRAVELGVPDIYMVGNSREFSFTEEDWAEIRKVWEEYSQKIEKE